MRYEDIPSARIEFRCGQVETLRGLNVVRRANNILQNPNPPIPAWRRIGNYLLEGLALSYPAPISDSHPFGGNDELQELS